MLSVEYIFALNVFAYSLRENIMTKNQSKTKKELQIEINQLEAKISELEKSELKSSIWLEHSPVCTKILDLDFNLQYMSSAGVKGLKIDDITAHYGTPYPLSFYSESFKIPMSEDLKRAKETGEARTHEATIQDTEGNTLWFLSTVIPVKNNKGQIDHFMIVSIDTTARKEAEDELNMTKEAMERTEEIAKLGGWSIDIKTMSPYLSKELFELYEIEPPNIPTLEEAINYYAHEDRPKIEKAVQDCIKTGKPYDLELRFITAKGNKRWVRSVGRAETKDDSIVKISGILQDITQKKDTLETIKNNEDQLEKLFIGITDGFALCEMIFDSHGKPADYRFLKINPAFEMQTGLKIRSAQGKTVKEIYPDIEQDWIDKYGSVVINNEPIHFEDYNHNTKKYYRVKAFHTIRNEFAMLFEDITKNKQAEKALQESEARFKALHNASFGGIAIHDKGQILDCNQGLSEITGYKENELIGMDGLLLIAEESREMVKRNILAEYEKLYEAIGVKKNGKKYPLRLEARMIPYKGQKVRVVEFRDITEQKQAEEELIKSEERFELAMAAAKDGLYDWDLKTNEIYYSPRWKSLLGYNDDELPNDFTIWEKLTRPEDVDASWNMQQELINKQRDRFELEFKMKHKDGHWVDILSRAEAVFDIEGEAIRIVGTHVDISERKKAEEKLSKERKIFEDLFNNVNSGVAIYKVINDGKFGKDYIIKNFNKKALELEGKTSKEVVGKSIDKLRPAIDDYGIIDEFRKVWQTGQASMYPTKEYIDENFSNYYENRIFRLPNNNIVAVYDDVTERKNNEEKILIAEENLQNTFNISPSIISKANVKTGHITVANLAVTRILGYTIEEVTSRPFLEFIHPDDRQNATDVLKDQLIGKDVNFLESRFLCKDGSYKWMAWHSTKADQDGIVTAVGSDISERKTIEQEIIKTKQFYENITEGVQDGIWVTDENDVIFYANSAMEKIAGVPREQIHGNNVLKDFPKETTGEIIGFYRQAKKEKKPVWYDLKVKTPAEKDTWQNGWLIPQYQNNSFSGMICTTRDVTDRRKAEGDVRKLSTAVQQSPSIIVITNKEGILEYINPQFTKTTGYTSAEAIGQKSNLLKSGKQDDVFYSEMWKTIVSGIVWRGQMLNKKKNGELFWEAASISSILNESGKLINYIKISEDITHQKQTEAELKTALRKALESDKLKSAFLANMSHEIRTPMNGILGFSSLLKEPGLSGEKQQQYIEIIEKSGARMLNTIHDIIDISKIEAGEMIVSTKKTSVNSVMDELYYFYSDESKMKGLSLYSEPSLSYEQARIITDSHKLHGILNNLIKNAIKYTDKGSIAYGYTLRNDGEVPELEFFVKDSGIGIPEDRLLAIFNRFEQADISDSRAFQGSGLGLAISKAYVEMLGGRIKAESEKGVGSKFTFTIPYVTTTKNEMDQLPEDINKEHLKTSKLNLLIVEDEEVSSKLLEAMLDDMFQNIIIERTGADAIETCKNNPEIDLVLMDIKMPLMDGLEATRQIRKFNKDIIIIAQTAYAMLGDKKKAIEAGCNNYIAKPTSRKLLLEMINTHLG